MAMSGILHAIFADYTVILAALLWQYFIALIETVRHFIIVTSTYEEKTSFRGLNRLEVMWEVSSHVDLMLDKLFSLEDILVNIL